MKQRRQEGPVGRGEPNPGDRGCGVAVPGSRFADARPGSPRRWLGRPSAAAAASPTRSSRPGTPVERRTRASSPIARHNWAARSDTWAVTGSCATTTRAAADPTRRPSQPPATCSGCGRGDRCWDERWPPPAAATPDWPATASSSRSGYSPPPRRTPTWSRSYAALAAVARQDSIRRTRRGRGCTLTSHWTNFSTSPH